MGNWLDYFQSLCEAYGYPALFLGVMLENAGIPVPGETAVLVAGILASKQAGGVFDIRIVIGLTIVAAVTGDNMGYWLGRTFARPYLVAGRRFLFLTPKALALAEGYFQRFGGWTIFFARFITGIRVVGALAAGTAGMPWYRFLLANTSGAVLWAATIALLGFFFAENKELLEQWIGRSGLIALGCVLLIGIPLALHRLRLPSKPPAAGPMPEKPIGE